MELLAPSPELLPSYVAALGNGWVFDDFWFGGTAAQLELAERDPQAMLARLMDGDHSGEVLALPNGNTAPRLPGRIRWMWDGSFAGSINVRWQPGTTELPPHALGHIGYGTVPDRRGRGYASAALALALPVVWEQGLPFADLVTAQANAASQRVIERNGGVFVESFEHPSDSTAGTMLRWRITRD